MLGLHNLNADETLMVYTALAASMPVLENNLALFFTDRDLLYAQDALPLLRDSRIPLLLERDLIAEVDFIPLNRGEGYGRLRVMDPDDRPHPHDYSHL